MQVLIVDDEKAGAFITGRMLTHAGFRVATVYSGPDALQHTAATPPDLVLLDLKMPGMDGYETCRAMRQQRGLKDVIILALTGYVDSEVEHRARAAGFDDVVEKSRGAKSLPEQINGWIKRRNDRRR